MRIGRGMSSRWQAPSERQAPQPPKTGMVRILKRSAGGAGGPPAGHFPASASNSSFDTRNAIR